MRPGAIPLPRAGGPDLAAELRSKFDQAFSQPAQERATELTGVLRARVGQTVYAIRLAEIAEVVIRPKISAVPSQEPAFLGVASSRGRVVAVYDLGLLAGDSSSPPRWMLTCSDEPNAAVSFEHLEGYRQLSAEAISATQICSMSTLLPRNHARPPIDRPGEKS